MHLFKRLFRKLKDSADAAVGSDDLNKTEEELVKEFSKLKSDEKIRRVMRFGESGDLRYYPLMKYSILNDVDINVKFAALKRIHLFKSHPNTISMLNKLGSENSSRNLEPYYSMALSRVGIISLQEFQDKMNS